MEHDKVGEHGAGVDLHRYLQGGHSGDPSVPTQHQAASRKALLAADHAGGHAMTISDSDGRRRRTPDCRQ
jgi:hypothetical protein